MLNRALSAGQTLLVKGPASFKVLNGAIEALGVEIGPRTTIVVRAGKTIPLTAIRSSNVELVLGEDASVETTEVDPFPEQWKSTLMELVDKGVSSVAVLGDTDSGKTTLCIMLANRAVKAGVRVALIDGDIGQAELGAPTTVSMRFIREQTVDLFSLGADKARFVGSTTPSALPGRLVDALEELNLDAAEGGAELVVLNTDGWVEGSAAIEHKVEIMSRLSPDVCVMLQSSEELRDLPQAIGRIGCQTLILPVPPSIKKRSKEERRELRQLGYRKALRGLACRTMRLSQVKLEGAVVGGTPLTKGKIEEPSAPLGSQRLCGKEEGAGPSLVIDDHERSGQTSASLPDQTVPAARIVPPGFERGLVAGLLDKHGELLALGMIEEIDHLRGAVRVLTGCKASVYAIQVGQVRLDRDCREVA